MLEEVGERRGVTRTPLFHFARADRHQRAWGGMTIRFTGGGPGEPSEVTAAEELYDEITKEVRSAIRRIRAGEADMKGTAQAARDMRQALLAVLEERARVAKLHKQDAGIVHGGYALDLDAARTEVCRRLACLRDAGGD